MAREMKDSGIEWIGEIPAEWSIGRIKYNYFLKGRIGWQGLKADEFIDEGPYLVTGTDFKKGRVDWSTCYHISQERYDEAPEIHVQSGDLLITKDGTVGKVAYIEEKPDQVSLNSHLLIMRPLNVDYSNRFLYWVIQSPEFIKYNLISQNGTVMASLSQEKINGFSYAMPSLKEQIRISDYLEGECAHIDSVIDQTRASIEEYKKLKQAVITQAVTKGIRPDRQMKDSGVEWIGEIPHDWKLCRLRHIGSAQNGISKGGEFFGEGYPFVSYGDVYRNYALPYEVNGLIQTTEEEQKLYSVERGDIFFTRTSETIEEVGFSCVCEQTIPKATFAGFLIRVRPYDDTLDTGYAKYYFRSNHHRFYLVKQMNLVTRASLGQPLLKGMHVLVPSKTEQKEIAIYLDQKCFEIDKLISNKVKVIADLESYKKSLIYECVTGKKKVPA